MITHPPTTDELLAYRQGRLSPEEEEEMRELLLEHPELVRVLAEPFPEPAQPGDPDYLSEHEFAAQRRALRRRKPFDPSRLIAVVAATVAIVFVGLFWRERTEQMQPRGADAQILMPAGARGGAEEAVRIGAGATPHVLLLQPMAATRHASYRAEILDEAGRVAWQSREPLFEQENTGIALLIPGGALRTGRYDVVLYGDGERVARYAIRVQ